MVVDALVGTRHLDDPRHPVIGFSVELHGSAEVVIGGHENYGTVPGTASFYGFAELSEDNISEGEAVYIAVDGGVFLGKGPVMRSYTYGACVAMWWM
jgi:hypothetical protein